MAGSRWSEAFRRLTARIALSAGLLGLAAQPSAEGGVRPRVPVTPELTPEVTVRKFKGRHVLKRSAGSFFIHLAGHRSHSSHSSHRSHSSHSSHRSGSHYSGSHFSSSPTPSRESAPRSAPTPPPPQPKPKPQPLLREDFETSTPTLNWTVGVLATADDTFDGEVATRQTGGGFRIAPRAQSDGAHFSGYVSVPSFNVRTASIAAELRQHAAGGTTLFAAAIDADNWIGFRVEGGQLWLESHTNGKVAARKVAYSATQHRFLRLRTSSVAPVVVWETSADGRNWTPGYVETATIRLDALRIALSAGTAKRVSSPGAAIFDNVIVELQP